MKYFNLKTIAIICFILLFKNLNAQGVWTKLNTVLPTSRYGLAAEVINNKIFTFGGVFPPAPYEFYDIVEEYDIANNSWSTKTSMSIKREGPASVVYNDKIWIIGGASGPGASPRLSTVEVYDPVNDSWEMKPPLSKKRWHSSAVVYNNKIYVFGGLDENNQAVAEVEVYSNNTNSWGIVTYMPTPRWAIGTVVVNEKAYIVCGTIPNGNFTNIVDVYDFQSNSWSTVTNAIYETHSPGVEAVDNKIYVIGGEKEGGANRPNPIWETVQVYDVLTGNWFLGSSMSIGIGSFGHVVYQNKIFTIGGCLGNDGSGLKATNEIYYFSSNQAPVAKAGEDQTIECSGIDGTNITLDGSSSSDVDGDPLTFTWLQNDEAISTESVTNLSLTVGEYSFTLVVDDGNGGTASDEVVITIEDTSPPTLVAKETFNIWPPNHKYVNLYISDMIEALTDGCSGELLLENVVITKVTSDEPEDDLTGGDGKTLNDIVIYEGCKSVGLRAERLGGSNGRVYTVTLAASDASGNIGTIEFEAYVPNDKKDLAIKGEPQYSVDGICEIPIPNQQLSKDMFHDNYSITKNIVPIDYVLDQNYPNPFNPSTTISYSIPKDEYVTLTIYDVLGNTVSVFENGNKSAGTYSYSFEASNLTSGLYFYTLKAGNFTLTKKMILLK